MPCTVHPDLLCLVGLCLAVALYTTCLPTKARCESLCLSRRRAGASAVAIHGDKDQYEREVALRVFTRGSARFLFATDVAARGLDVKGVTHVINFDMPQVIIA